MKNLEKTTLDQIQEFKNNLDDSQRILLANYLNQAEMAVLNIEIIIGDQPFLSKLMKPDETKPTIWCQLYSITEIFDL